MLPFKSVFAVLCLGFISATFAGIPAGCKVNPVVIVHGGAGDIAPTSVACKKRGVIISANWGYGNLTKDGGSAIDAVIAAINYMEEDPCFNAGYGGVLTSAGNVEMDAAIMDGSDLSLGAGSVITDILHPIQVADAVRRLSRHNYLVGQGVMDFATSAGFKKLPKGALVSPNSKKALEAYLKAISEGEVNESELGEPGTVGAVAIDCQGNIAAATSTGGLTGKAPGRVGDSSIAGAGTYADNRYVGCSATGHGETIMKYAVSSKILAKVQYEGKDAQVSTEEVLQDMTDLLTETAGTICIDANGDVGYAHTSKHLAWAYRRDNEVHYGIDSSEAFVQNV